MWVPLCLGERERERERERRSWRKEEREDWNLSLSLSLTYCLLQRERERRRHLVDEDSFIDKHQIESNIFTWGSQSPARVGWREEEREDGEEELKSGWRGREKSSGRGRRGGRGGERGKEEEQRMAAIIRGTRDEVAGGLSLSIRRKEWPFELC